MLLPLEGIKVVDLSRVLAGPHCAQILGDLGAEVIKIERLNVGDETRNWGNVYIGGENSTFICFNRNKKSMALNLKSEEGKCILLQLVKKMDVLVENFRPGTMDRLQLGYDSLKEINPRLIYASITGFGPNGPYKDRPGYDYITQGLAGLMSVCGEPNEKPMRVGLSIIDMAAATYTAVCITAALISREKTGVGVKIDTCLLDTMVCWLSHLASQYLISGKVPQRHGSRHYALVPSQIFKTKDGEYILIQAGNDEMFKSLCKVLGLDHFPDAPRFKTGNDRLKNIDELIPHIENIVLTKTSKEWLKLLAEAEVPSAPANTIDKVFQDPQVIHQKIVEEIDHPSAGKINTLGIPVQLSYQRPNIRRHPPLLGEHTAEICRNMLGLSEEEIEEFEKKGVIGVLR